MRVLHIYKTYFPDPPGGLQEAIRQICFSTQDLGVENRIFTLSPNPIPEKIKRPEGLVVRAKSWYAPASCDLGSVGAFKLFDQQVSWADVLHFHFPWPFADLLDVTASTRRPKVMTYHSDIINKGVLGSAYNLFVERMLKSMDAVVATSPAYMKGSVYLNSFVKPLSLKMIPLELSQRSYSKAINDAKIIDVQNNFRIKKNSYFLFVGALRSYKGISYLIDAARQTGLEVVIAGSELSSKERERSKNLSNVHFIGVVSESEKMALIRDCKALVLPSIMRSEAFGLVLLEAMMMSKPVISTEISTGTSYVNEHLRTGLVVTPRSVDELAAAMSKINDETESSSSFGANARKRFEDSFSGTRQGQSYCALYENVSRKP